jgi:hypothetical protein
LWVIAKLPHKLKISLSEALAHYIIGCHDVLLSLSQPASRW